jgi:hypothetical protein
MSKGNNHLKWETREQLQIINKQGQLNGNCFLFSQTKMKLRPRDLIFKGLLFFFKEESKGQL